MQLKETEQLLFPLLKTIEITLGVYLGQIVKDETTFCVYTEEKVCGRKAYKGSFCKIHYDKMEEARLMNGKRETKTKPKAVDILNSIISQKITELHRHPMGLLEPETGILFDENFHVIGVFRNGMCQKLTVFDADKCERYGWVYSVNIVETDEERLTNKIDIEDETDGEHESEEDN